MTENIGITADLSLKDVDAIIFDEVHYINDPHRGNVWEECFILLPPSIHLVLLSATLDRPDIFAHWLGNLKQVPVHVISTDYRVVPLVHKIGKDVLMDEKNVFHDRVYMEFLQKQAEEYLARDRRKDAVRNRQAGEAPIAKEERSGSFIHQMNEHIAMLERENLLPCLFFVFSRKKCMEYAKDVTHNLITSSDGAAIRHILSFHLHRFPDLQKLPQYHELERLLMKGVAYHHSGMLPVLKEIVEILFGRGFVKVLFATETFAVGINMPTKTVVFTSFRKFDDECESPRILRTDEYLQMAGRAGRRGKDTLGVVYYLPDGRPDTTTTVRAMMTGRPAQVSSKMNFGYDFLLKALHSGHLKWETILKSSYWYAMNETYAVQLEASNMNLNENIPEVHPDCEERYKLEMELKCGNRQAQSKLETWKNKHNGPTWEAHWKTYQSWKHTQSLIAANNHNIRELRAIPPVLQQRLDYLERTGFLKDGQLTQLGHMAAEINEGHSLVMAKAFHDKVLHGRPPHELVAILASFLDEQSKVGVPLEALAPIYRELKGKEIEKSPETYWRSYDMWCDPIYDWLQGDDFGGICETYGVDAGSFARAILKVSNIVDEWINLATYSEDLETLEACKDLRQRLVRGLVVPDSLYLRA